jgi:Xaa-Pro aminopeptidase
MTSPLKVAANRRNALRSTGPKGPEGRVRASLNATRHGLSVPLDGTLLSRDIQRISDLVRPECGSDEEAQRLARLILEYERNESVQRGYLIDETPDPSRLGAQATLNNTRAEFPEYDMLEDEIWEEKMAPGPSSRSEIRQMRAFQREMLKLIVRGARVIHRSREKKRAQSLRYLRRAANQLAKGLRAATAG